MPGSLAYVDTSAYLKLLFEEYESAAFGAAASEWPEIVSSELLDVEMHRAAYRAAIPASGCDALLDAVTLISLSDPIRELARRIAQPHLRAADAIHLATAASLSSDIGVLFAYDNRMLEGALLEGLPAWAPRPGAS